MYHVTRILLSAREDIKYSPRAIILLIGMQIVDMKQLDEHLAKVGGEREESVVGEGGIMKLLIVSHMYMCTCTMYVFEFL